jgi:hypothetical protein
LLFQETPPGVADPRFQLVQFAPPVCQFAGERGPIRGYFSFTGGNGFCSLGQIARLRGGGRCFDGSSILPFPPLPFELPPRFPQPALVQLGFAVELLNVSDELSTVGGEPVGLLMQSKGLRFGFNPPRPPMPPAALDQPATQVGESLPLGLCGTQRLSRFLPRGRQLSLLLFRDSGVGRPLLPQRRPGFGDLILQVEQLPPLLLEPAGELLLLPGKGGLALSQSKFLLAHRRLLGDDRGRLNAQRLQ